MKASTEVLYTKSEDPHNEDYVDMPPEGQISSDQFRSNFEEATATDNHKTMKRKRLHQESQQYFHMNETYCRICKTDHRKCEMCKYFYVIGDETYAVHGTQEPWPKDVKLFQPYEVEQILLPDNANCLAVQAFLRMCNLDFQTEQRPNAEFMSPTGKVPFIKCGAFLVAELEGIVTFIGQKGITLTEHLDSEQKADLRAYLALINNVLGPAENYVCWCDRETYREVTKPRNGSVYPWPLNLMQTWSKRSKQIKALKTLGWYEKSLEEVFQEVETCCQALTDRLENNTYFFGTKYTELDALLYGHIYVLLTTYIPAGRNNFAQIIRKFDKLVKHCKRIDSQVMGRETDLIQSEWLKPSRADLTQELKTYEEDVEKCKTEIKIEHDTVGDVERETDWLVIDKKNDTETVGDALPTYN
ncbi:metaxin related [Holotrichia oblita]|uniref:Metaxin related n=1 Tax=Holotrichia oblita TaxID=644536 RepID=A0ACB9TN86_HOLOL|nr:metaxin related [Holotrichia oblita]